MSKILSPRSVKLFIVILIGGASVFALVQYRTALTRRQALIHQNGASVMPFDLNQTSHIFKKTDSGGVQQVIAKKPDDAQQISLIRMHLQMEASLFQKGDFSDPSKLHGQTMPGLTDLEKGSEKMNITYADIPGGGQITYTTTDTRLVKTIHDWFDAQLSDHGSDAMGM